MSVVTQVHVLYNQAQHKWLWCTFAEQRGEQLKRLNVGIAHNLIAQSIKKRLTTFSSLVRQPNFGHQRRQDRRGTIHMFRHQHPMFGNWIFTANALQLPRRWQKV